MQKATLEVLSPLLHKEKKKEPLLQVENLRVSFSIGKLELFAVRGISFEIQEGEAVGIVGESGCGKSASVEALTRLTPASKIEGKAFFEGRDLLSLSEEEMRKIRGKKIGHIFQDPFTSLNPTMKIGKQITEAILYHRLADRRGAEEKALELLHLVGVPEPHLRLRQYPHQLSGGMRQRILIAIALSCNPRLLIADEPTTALDVTIQAQILELLKKMQRHFQTSLLLITHDLGVVAEVCDRVLVFYAGKIVEQGKIEEVLYSPRHPYTQMLLRSLPRLDRPRLEPLQAIEGVPPSLFHPPSGCPFMARCPFAMPICNKEPPFFGRAACWKEVP